MELNSLKKYLNYDSCYTKQDIKEIVDHISCDNNFLSFNGLIFKTKHNFFMGYNFKNNKIEIDYDSLSKTIEKRYQSLLGIPYHVYFNLSSLLFIFHEFNHVRQNDDVLNNQILGELYKKSIEFLCVKKKEIKPVHSAIYLKYHDIFTTEVNADFQSMLDLIQLLMSNDSKYYLFYIDLFINHLKYLYYYPEYDDVHDLILDDLYIMEELQYELDEKDQILNGIKRINIEDREELKRILNLK